MRFALLLLAASSPLASAQTTLSVHAGYADFDLSGTGNAAVVDVRASYPINRYLSLDGGLGFSHTDQQFGDVAYLLPSVELHVGATVFGRVRPHLGVGVGALVPVADEGPQVVRQGEFEFTVDPDPDAEATINVALGVDVAVTDRWVVLGSGRLRGTVGDGPDFFVGTLADVSAGVGYRF